MFLCCAHPTRALTIIMYSHSCPQVCSYLYTYSYTYDVHTNIFIILFPLSSPQNKSLFKRKKYHCVIDFSVPEVKILLLLSYFIVLGVLSLVNFSFSAIYLDPFLDDLFRYFVCELPGDSPSCADIRKEFESHLTPGLNVTSFSLLALLTWVHLLFAVQIQDAKRLIQRILLYCQAYSNNTK